jgi:hypothetical protein
VGVDPTEFFACPYVWDWQKYLSICVAAVARDTGVVDSLHRAVFVNRFSRGQDTVYTLFNASYRTARFSFQGWKHALGPRDVEVVPGTQN